MISNESCVFVLLSCDKVPAWNYGNEAPRAGVLSAMSLNYVEDKFIGKLLFSRNPPMWIPPRAPPNIIRSTHGLLAEAGEILGQPGSPRTTPLPATHSFTQVAAASTRGLPVSVTHRASKEDLRCCLQK